ncbi:S41 family peptidase [Ancylomarina sp. DW003]|nr:S41 family peptidase [Ancylomarina sp. DW003]MDE5421362.1 S41 family peptidase [Ancylomarina sp. DW003]
MKNIYYIIMAVILVSSCQSIKITDQTNYTDYLKNNKYLISKDNLMRSKESIKEIHPNPFNSISEVSFDSLVTEVAKTFPQDSICETEFIYQYRKAYDTITYGDPHFLIYPQLKLKKGVKLKNKHILVWPFSLLCIGDTLLIDKSLNSELQKGDRIVSINDRTDKEIVKYTYHHRFLDSRFTQAQNHFCFAPKYTIKFQRKNTNYEITIDGIPLNKYYFKDEYYPQKLYDDYQTGYFGIHNFDNNKYMIKRLSKFIERVQSKGFKDIIIDVRRNPGGRGDRFDELISLFSPKDSIEYLKASRIKVSKQTLDYGFSEDQIGQVCNTPEDYIVRNCPLDKSRYAGKMNYYILVSKYTASTASTFANIMQYNKFGILVGEPLAHNALKFGEVIISSFQNSVIVISGMEMDEYSNQKEGVIQPDILIPYSAFEYMNGGDPVLNHCLEYIRKNKATYSDVE